MDGRDRVHVLFSGTSLVSTISAADSEQGAEAGTAASAKAGFTGPPPPNNGCVCFVLRTGFSSSQGELIQMIEFSTQQVSADSKETLLALGILLCFALVAAGYVFKKGMEKGDRTTHELLLKCVIIITSVVPQQLPMQMALAVNTAMMALMKKGIFCTEPYRVQFSGKVSHCLFDKTGTLTTDQLVPAGVLSASKAKARGVVEMLQAAREKHVEPTLDPIADASSDASLVIAACHSLVDVEGTGLVGDPIELAGLDAIKWDYSSKTQVVRPGGLETLQKASAVLKAKPPGADASPEEKAKHSKQLLVLEAQIQKVQSQLGKSPIDSAKILHRYHFSSKLKRMSTIVEVTGKNGGRSGACCLVKGSPEAIASLLAADGGNPEWYDMAYRLMAEKGMRVLALAYKWVETGESTAELKLKPRDWAEEGLTFAGFIAFKCMNRADSKVVIQALKSSAHTVSMVTGDAALTALHVAQSLDICNAGKTALMLEQGKDGKVHWAGAVGDAYQQQLTVPFSSPGTLALQEKYDLVATEDMLLAAVEESGGKLWAEVDAIAVFARMSPQGKATVIRMIQEHQDRHVLMCGDGGNDVGALKQADCGIALLGGYGNTNTEEDKKDGDKKADDKKADAGGVDNMDAEQALNSQIKDKELESTRIRKLVNEHMSKKRSEFATKQAEVIKTKMEAGAGIWQAGKEAMAETQQALQKEQQLMAKKYGSAYSPKKDALSEALAEAGEAEDPMQIIRPGDASVAAPFTSRVPSIRSVVDLIRQGRCTLLSALQQQQIMMLQCIISAYTFSAISLEGARSSERQMMASGWLIMIASLAFSYSTPVEKMSPERPIKSLFHPAIFISMMGQAAIHLSCMVYAVNLATETMGPAKLKEVTEFHKKVRAGESVTPETDGEEDPWAEFALMWAKPFLPNLMNTVIFLVETAQIMAVLLVNYKGQPWMIGVVENHALCLSLFICIGGLVTMAWGVSPQLNEMIHLHDFPDDEFRWKVITLVGISLVGTFIWDRIITAVFAPKIFAAMMREAKKTTVMDVMPVFMTLGKVVLGFTVFASGNILLWGGTAWYFWKRRQAAA